MFPASVATLRICGVPTLAAASRSTAHGPDSAAWLGQLGQGDQAADQGFRGGHRHRTGLAHGAQIDQDVGLVGAVFDLLQQIRPAAGEGERPATWRLPHWPRPRRRRVNAH